MARNLRWTPLLLAASLSMSMATIDVAGAATSSQRPHLVRLSPTPQLPSDAKRISAVKASRRFTLTIGLAPRHPQAFDAFVAGVSTPGSPTYRAFLKPGDYAKRFGPSAASLAPLTKSLEAAGFTVEPLHGARQLLKVAASAKTISTYFHTEMANFTTRNGEHHFSVTSAPRIDSSLRPLISGISGLGSFNTLSPSVTTVRRAAAAIPTCPTATDLATSGYGITTTQLGSAYGLDRYYSAGTTGQGVTVGIYELARYKSADIASYARCYGITPNIVNINVNGGPPAYSPSAPSEATEPTLDIDHVLSVAPGAQLLVYQAPNSTAANPSAPNDLLARIAADDLAQVITTSWGLCESDNPDPGGVNFENGLFKQMAAQGQTFIAASGDNGPADCAGNGSHPTDVADAVDDPASQPYVTGVGATRTTSFTPLVQSAWGRGSLGGGGSGGGLSSVWPRPAWQVVTSTDARVNTSTQRMVPDVSLNGDPRSGVLIYQSDEGGWFPVGGTSAASPLLAAIVALAESSCGKTVGFLNPTLYRSALVSPSNFADVTAGSSSVGTGTVFNATTGYDLASGLGTPLAGALDSLCAEAASAKSSSTLIGRPTNVGVTLLSSADLATGDTLTITWPRGMTLPSNPASLVASANGDVSTLTWKSFGTSSSSTTINQMTYTVASPLPAGSLLSVGALAALNATSKVPSSVSVTSSAQRWTVVAAPMATLTGTAAWTTKDLTAANRALTGKATLGGLLAATPLTTQLASVASKVILATGTAPSLNAATLSFTSLPETSGVFTGPVQFTKVGAVFIVAGVSTTGHVLVARGTSTKTKFTITDLTKSAGLTGATAGALCLSSVGASPTLVASGAIRLTSGRLVIFTATSPLATAFSTTDLTALTGLTISSAPACAGSASGLLLGVRSSAGELFVVSTSGAVVTAQTNVSASTTLGAISTNPISVTVGPLGSAVAVSTTSGHAWIANLVPTSGTWEATDVSAAARSSAILASPVVVSSQARLLVVGWSKLNHLIVLSQSGPSARWNAYDATAAWGLSGVGTMLRGSATTSSTVLSWVTAAGHVTLATTQVAL